MKILKGVAQGMRRVWRGLMKRAFFYVHKEEAQLQKESIKELKD